VSENPGDLFLFFLIEGKDDLAYISGSIYPAAIGVVTIRWLYLAWMEPAGWNGNHDYMVTAEEAMVRNPIDAPFIPVKSSQGLKGSRVETRLLQYTPPLLGSNSVSVETEPASIR